MSKFEHVSAELERIKQEAAQREAVKLAQQRADEHKEFERARLVDSNWSLSQSEIIRVLRELNRTVLDSKGKIEDWNHMYYDHVHGHEVQYDGGSSVSYCGYEGEIVRAGLKIPKIGGIFFIRSFDSKYYSFSERYADKVYVAWGKEVPRYAWEYKDPCPECEGTSFRLDLQPEEVKNRIEEGATTSLEQLFSEFYSR